MCWFQRNNKEGWTGTHRFLYYTFPWSACLILPFPNSRNSLVSAVNICSKGCTSLDFTTTKNVFASQCWKTRARFSHTFPSNPDQQLLQDNLSQRPPLPPDWSQRLIFKASLQSLTTPLKYVFLMQISALPPKSLKKGDFCSINSNSVMMMCEISRVSVA